MMWAGCATCALGDGRGQGDESLLTALMIAAPFVIAVVVALVIAHVRGRS